MGQRQKQVSNEIIINLVNYRKVDNKVHREACKDAFLMTSDNLLLAQRKPYLRITLVKSGYFTLLYIFLSSCRSDTRTENLKDAFHRMVRFHEEMINGLTWLTTTESTVAELDTMIDSSHSEGRDKVETLKIELKVGTEF